MKYIERLDHNSENYTGVEGLYNGMDYNDYLFEKWLESYERENNK